MAPIGSVIRRPYLTAATVAVVGIVLATCGGASVEVDPKPESVSRDAVGTVVRPNSLSVGAEFSEVRLLEEALSQLGNLNPSVASLPDSSLIVNRIGIASGEIGAPIDMPAGVTRTGVEEGDLALPFTLPSAAGPYYSLESFRGDKNVVLLFYQAFI